MKKQSSRLVQSVKSRGALVLLVGVVAGQTLVGCVAPKRGYVAREWSQTMRELSIVPVFPPREDVQVGDVYISPTTPDREEEFISSKGYLPLGLWVGTLDVSNEVASFYGKRNTFPKTTEATSSFMTNQTTNPFLLLAQSADTNRNVFVGGDTSRLRMVGFPGFMSATFTQADLNGVIPAEAVSVAFGAGYSSSHNITVSIPVAESYALPAADVMSKLIDPETKKFAPSKSNMQAPFLVSMSGPQHAGRKLPPDVKIDYGYIRVITEVFYARAVDVSIQRKKPWEPA